MKKYLLIPVFFLFSMNAFAKSYDFYSPTNLNGAPESVAKSNFGEFGKTYGQIMNGGMGNIMNMDTFKVSLGGMIVPFDKDGIMTNSSNDYLPAEIMTAGVSLYGFNIFARGIALVEDGRFIAGGGVGYQIKTTNLVTLTPFITYHRGINLEGIPNLNSFGAHVQAKANFLDKVIPFASLGVSYTRYETNIILDTGEYFTYDQFLIHSSVGVRVLYFYYEFSLTPKIAHAVGFTYDF